ncbi:MAG: hypothetical protein GX442_18890 [Candidatus Riflebacteria bacterium]|nr:hypothetical protein [Candidatus Riflebacteria bacterium]
MPNLRSCKPLLLAVLILVAATAAPAGAAGPIERLDRWFVFGTNLAWFNGNYGADIGVNHAEGGWNPVFTPELCEKVFANLEKMGCPVVRVWAFERQEGLTFTPDLTTDPKYPYHEVTGLDPVFLANARILMDTAARHHVMVYWSLLNHLIREEQGGRHMRIITDPKVRASYLNNAAVPFLKEFASHPAFFAVDIINEADGAVGGTDALTGGKDPRLGCSWKQMRVFIKACADAFHAAVPGLKVTCTSGWNEERNLKAGRFSGLGLDFYDWHSYRDAPVLPHARDLGLDKPVIIGECGPKTETPDAGFALQEKNWRAYLREARKGYAGLLTWSYGNPGADNNFVMVGKDHAWRAGARFIHEVTRGSAIPDAGPLLLTEAERAERNAIQAALPPVLGLGRDPALCGTGSPLAKRLLWLARETGKYFPYLNLRYARLSLDRAAGEIAALGRWQLAARTPSPVRVRRLQAVGKSMLAAVAAHPPLLGLDSLQRLAAFVALDPAGPAPASNSPFDGDFTPVAPAP